MKKNYEEAMIEVVLFNTEDVLAASGDLYTPGQYETDGMDI